MSDPHDRRPVLWEAIPEEVKTKARAQVGYKRFSFAEEYERRQRELRDRRTPDLPACSACGSHVPESELTADEQCLDCAGP